MKNFFQGPEKDFRIYLHITTNISDNPSFLKRKIKKGPNLRFKGGQIKSACESMSFYEGVIVQYAQIIKKGISYLRRLKILPKNIYWYF